MERTITGTVGEVQGRTVNTKYGEKTVFDITIGSQKTSTFKSDIAEEANALKGSDVEATVRVEPREGYPDNYMLQSVKLVDAYPAAAQPSTSSTTIPVTTATEKKGWQPEDTARVTRLSCLSTAFHFMGSLYSDGGADAVEMATDDAITLARNLYGIAMNEQPEKQPLVASEPAETNDGIEW